MSTKFLWTSFFDDFGTLAKKDEAQSMDISTSQFFRLLGWIVSTGDKDLPFSKSFKALGVEIDFSSWSGRKVTFRNTQKRVQELRAAIGVAIESGKLSASEALSLRGRMQFAKSQIWGRSAKLCLSAVIAHAYSANGSTISDHTRACLMTFHSCLANSRPREITSSWGDSFFLFTDACFKPEDESWPCGLGGVLCDSTGRQVAAISIPLSFADLEILGYPAKSTVIFEAELLALVLCVKIWKKALCHKPCVMYVDNNSTREVSISGSARTHPRSAMVGLLLQQEDSACVKAWYSRFPSESNYCDPPSRNSSEGIHVEFLPQDFVVLHLRRGSCRSCQIPVNVGGFHGAISLLRF